MHADVIFHSFLIGMFLQTICILLVNYTKLKKWNVLSTLIIYTTPIIITVGIVSIGTILWNTPGFFISTLICVLSTCLNYFICINL